MQVTACCIACPGTGNSTRPLIVTRPPQLATIGGDLQFKVGSEPPLPQFYSTYISHARTWIPEVNADGKNPGCRGFELATLRSRVGLLSRSATEAVPCCGSIRHRAWERLTSAQSREDRAGNKNSAFLFPFRTGLYALICLQIKTFLEHLTVSRQSLSWVNASMGQTRCVCREAAQHSLLVYT